MPIAAQVAKDYGDAVLATVNGDRITAEAFRSSYIQYLIQSGRNDTPQSRRLHLDGLINTYLLAQEARRRGLDADSAHRAFADRKIRQMLGSRYVERTFVDSLPALTEEQLREAFQRTNTALEVRHLFFRDPEAARAAHARLKAGADFVALANELYRTPEPDSMAGHLGLVSYWDLDDAVAVAAYALPVGGYSEPVRSRFGWHILRVEDRITNPILTEAAYLNSRKKLAGRIRTRQHNVQGGHFVERVMENAKVTLDREGVLLLSDALTRLTGAAESPSGQEPPLSAEEVRSVRAELRPETILATYEVGGTPYTFTALDYYRWIEELPPSEVRDRPGVSVGRALRNEVLAAQALAYGLEADEEVIGLTAFNLTQDLALRISSALAGAGPVEPTENELRTAFEKMGYGRSEITADYWSIPFNSAEEAEQALAAIKAGTEPASFDGYAAHRNADEEALGYLAGHIRRAPRGQTVLAGLREGEWLLLHVEHVDARAHTLDDVRGQLATQLAPYLTQMRLLTQLRADAQMEVDWALYESLFERRADTAQAVTPAQP